MIGSIPNPHMLGLARHSTNELLLLAQKGDALAFEAFYFQTHSFLRSFLRKRRWITRTPEDVVQEVFCRVWERQGVFVVGRASAKSYLISIALNVAHEQHRKAIISRRFMVNLAIHVVLEDHTANGVLQKDLGQRIRIARGGLSQNQEAAVRLVYDDQLDIIQAAERLGCSQQAIHRRLQEARRKLIVMIKHQP